MEGVVIIGAGHTGAQAAKTLRREGWRGAITLIGAETELPYQRPPLSKEILTGVQELSRTAACSSRRFWPCTK